MIPSLEPGFRKRSWSIKKLELGSGSTRSDGTVVNHKFHNNKQDDQLRPG
jgi:hypothetical protein